MCVQSFLLDPSDLCALLTITPRDVPELFRYEATSKTVQRATAFAAPEEVFFGLLACFSVS